MNKIGGLLFDPDMRLLFAGRAQIDFRSILDNRMILLVKIPKGIMGGAASALLGAFIVGHLQKAALSRANATKRRPFYLYLDEFQNYTTDNIQEILSESRKYGLSLTLAHQYLDQLSADLRSAVLNTTGTLISFRIGHKDATKLVREIFPSGDFIQTREIGLKLDRFGSWPLFKLNTQEKGIGWDGLAQMLTDSKDREFWVKKRGNPWPTKQYSLDMPVPGLSPIRLNRLAQLTSHVGQRYGRLKSELRAEIARTRTGFSTYKPSALLTKLLHIYNWIKSL